MSLPFDIQEKIDQILEKTDVSVLRKARDNLSQSYRQKNSSESIFSQESGRLAYLATRFPATFAAVHFVLKHLLQQRPDFVCQKILDLGAGPATASLAALQLMPKVNEVVLVEKSKEAILLGKQLFPQIQQEWICKDLKTVESFPKADLAILSYSLGEIKPFDSLLDRLWKGDINTIAIIEPGTPEGYRNILQARDFFLRSGAHILAPCPHAKACPIKEGDWCHFATRLERTKLHRLLKEGTLGFEDEKFSYVIVSRASVQKTEQARILRHPFKGSGHVKLTLCTEEGEFVEKTVSRKDKDLYRSSRDAEWGDLWPADIHN